MKKTWKILTSSLLLAYPLATAHAADKVPEAMKIPVDETTTPTDTTNKRVQETKHGDDSSRNEIHDGKSAVTAMQQSNDKGDIEITRKIRQAVVKDKGLSTYAHNVKIITVKGKVVLKGPVRNNEEKLRLEDFATQVGGADNVLSEIEVTR